MVEVSGRNICFTVAVAIGFFYLRMFSSGDPLNDFSENSQVSYSQLQAIHLGLCLNFPLVDKLAALNNETSNIAEDDYAKQSIYSLLYSLYRLVGETKSDKGIPYEFTFNTWGIDGTFFPEDDPQRFGKEAYRRLTAFPEVEELIKTSEHVNILEVGCGTGAGANLTSYLIPNSHYIALDMQAQAIETCNRLHAHEAYQDEEGGHGKLQCVQANGMALPFPADSFDIVIVSETHIAEHGYLTPEDLKILDQISYVLKPGGHFSWGNALITNTWTLIEKYMEEHSDWETIVVNDVTKEAVAAREKDFDRVEKYIQDVDDLMLFFTFFPTCSKVINHLILDFYRHPGTRLFNTMVKKTHSYKQASFRLMDTPVFGEDQLVL